MSFEYVRERYGVPARRGGLIRFQGEPGRILSASGGYIFADVDGRRCKLHPTWEVEYLPAEEVRDAHNR